MKLRHQFSVELNPSAHISSWLIHLTLVVVDTLGSVVQNRIKLLNPYKTNQTELKARSIKPNPLNVFWIGLCSITGPTAIRSIGFDRI